MFNSLFVSCEVLYIDHVAVTTPAFKTTLADYLALPGSRLVKGPKANNVQKVSYAFVRLPDGVIVEILEPMAESPIANHVQRGGGVYHFCFAVPNLGRSVAKAIENGAKLVSPPQPDPAFDGRPVAFLFHSAHGILEFVEAYPAQSNPAGEVQPVAKESAPISSPGLETLDELDRRLRRVFQSVFPKLAAEQIPQASFNTTSEWDSLMHIQLISQVEVEFGVIVPSEAFGRLLSYSQIFALLLKLHEHQQ